MTEKFIMAGTTPLHLCDSEVGEKCVVLLHGYLESMLVWDDFVPLLRSSVRVVTLDIPGHGVSIVDGECHTMEWLADVIVAAMDKIGVSKFTVVGHSMGGYVALAMCAAHAERLDGVVLLSSSPNGDNDQKRENREREIALIKAGKKDLLSAVAPAAGFAPQNKRAMKDYIEDLREQVFITEDEGIVALLNGMMARKDQNEMLQQSPVKQLFVFGRCDQYIPTEVAEQIAAAHPQAQVVWLEESGHNGFLEQPKECAEAILSFI